MTTHYERLGVAPGATREQVRLAYRALARTHHPDKSGDAAGDMAAINAAWSVLSDPVRRAEYDRQLGHTAGPTPDDGRVSHSTTSPTAPSWPPERPARMPWKFVAGTGIIGTVVILGAGAIMGPDAPSPVSPLLYPGACVAIDFDRREARATDCALAHDAVVREIVDFDEPCPFGTEGFRDVQGLGNACVVTSG